MEFSSLNIDLNGSLWKRLDPFCSQFKHSLVQNQVSSSSNIIIAEEDPVLFLSSFFSCLATGNPVFLVNPGWKADEKAQVLSQLGSGFVVSEGNFLRFNHGEVPEGDFRHNIMIPTGGSSGKLRFAIHNASTLAASAKGTIDFMGNKPLNSLCLLPLYHVSGLMQAIRALLSGGDVVFRGPDFIRADLYPEAEFKNWVVSLVPTQLSRILASVDGFKWLTQFSAVFLGGAKSHQVLLEKARAYALPIVLTYGATETAGMIAALPVEHFWRGEFSSGKPLLGNQVNISGSSGVIGVSGGAVFKGYYPLTDNSNYFFNTKDIGRLDDFGMLHVEGRADTVIITGGEKVSPEFLAEKILEVIDVEDVFVLGIPDENWGEAVVACVQCKDEKFYPKRFNSTLKKCIPKYMVPKKWIRIDLFPRGVNGKLSLSEMNHLVQNKIAVGGTHSVLKKHIKERQESLKLLCSKLLKGKKDIVLEIGCGHGDYLIDYAELNPDKYFVGIDIMNKRLGRADSKKRRRSIENITFIKAEANELLSVLPDSIQISEVFILFPDPWPKRRHSSRRLIQQSLLNVLAKKASSETLLYLRTDQTSYFEWTKQEIAANSFWETADELPWPMEPETFFQKLVGPYQSLVAKIKSS